MSKNIFAKAAEESTANLKSTEKAIKTLNKKSVEKDEELVGLSIRIPFSLRKAICQHRVDTGESGNALITRLLEKELKNG